MKVKSKIFKRKSGKSKGKWSFRITYFDELLGKSRNIERLFETKSAATDECDRLIDDVKKTHGQYQTGERMTFKDLANICEREFYQPAQIIEGRKVKGVRSVSTAKYQLVTLKNFFGNRLIQNITTESLTDYKLWRLTTDSKKTGKPVKISTVNRELSAMRKMMRFAYGKGWIVKDIFYNAKVIDSSNEIERTRLLTFAEEIRLLASCQGEREIKYTRNWKGKKRSVKAKISVDNPHLKAIIILALDSAMRKGEILKLRWKDIDFENNLIHIVGTHTKTERERIVPLSDRVKSELLELQLFTEGEKPFPFKDFKRSFNTAKRIAKIDDLHFHDLRRSAITRWIQNDVPIALAGKLAGHSQLQTTMKHYTSTDADIIQEINEKMNQVISQNREKHQINSKMVN